MIIQVVTVAYEPENTKFKTLPLLYHISYIMYTQNINLTHT